MEEKSKFIGAFDINTGEPIDEAALVEANRMKIGDLKDKQGKSTIAEVYVHSNEGVKPHLHIMRSGKTKNGRPYHDICVRLDKNVYFAHGNNDGLFEDAKQKASFHKFMSGAMDEDQSMTRWEYACMEWNVVNPGNKFTPPDKMPVYRTITDIETADDKKVNRA